VELHDVDHLARLKERALHDDKSTKVGRAAAKRGKPAKGKSGY
jgi:hypothetical protein